VDWRESEVAALGVQHGPWVSSRPTLPPADVLALWELAVASNPEGAIESEWRQHPERSYLSVAVTSATGSQEGDWDRLLTVARAAVAVTSTSPVGLRFIGRSAEASVIFHTGCTEGAPPRSELDRTEEFLEDLGPDAPPDAFIGSCGE
jgi:hypothetical protein